uniref:Uncharacterized protein n=1 Tax=Oryza punctata TaxID=4537 RepID=A0A0E0LA94_ORYPU
MSGENRSTPTPVESTNPTRSFQWNPRPLLDPSPSPPILRATSPFELGGGGARAARCDAIERTVEDDEAGLASEVVTK